MEPQRNAIHRNSSCDRDYSDRNNRNITFANNSPNVGSKRYLFAESRQSSQRNIAQSRGHVSSSPSERELNYYDRQSNRVQAFKRAMQIQAQDLIPHDQERKAACRPVHM